MSAPAGLIPRPRFARRAAVRGVAVARFARRNATVVLFVLGLLVLDAAVGRFRPVWQRHSPDDYAARVDGCKGRPRDVVFVGGSPVAEGIDPDRIAGVTWGGTPLADGYAVGLSGGTTSDFYHAVLRSCPTPPKVLVYGITASDINDARHEPHGPAALMTWGDWLGWVRLRPDSAEWVTRHFLQSRLGGASNLYRERHGIRMWAATEANRLIPGFSPEALKEADELRAYADALASGSGYAPAKGFATGRFDERKAAGLTRDIRTFPYLDKFRTGSHLRYLHKLVDWCEANGVSLVLVDMPVTADLDGTVCPAQFAEFRRRLAEIENDRGLTVLRATREAVGLGDTDFADLIHLNRDGARKLSDWVRGALEHADVRR